MSKIDEAFALIESRFNKQAAVDLNVVFQFIVDDEAYHLVISDGDCHLSHGQHEEPSLTLIMDSDTFKEVVKGEINGMQAFLTGKLRTEGNMMLATHLSSLFSL